MRREPGEAGTKNPNECTSTSYSHGHEYSLRRRTTNKTQTETKQPLRVKAPGNVKSENRKSLF